MTGQLAMACWLAKPAFFERYGNDMASPALLPCKRFNCSGHVAAVDTMAAIGRGCGKTAIDDFCSGTLTIACIEIERCRPI